MSCSRKFLPNLSIESLSRPFLVTHTRCSHMDYKLELHTHKLQTRGLHTHMNYMHMGCTYTNHAHGCTQKKYIHTDCTHMNCMLMNCTDTHCTHMDCTHLNCMQINWKQSRLNVVSVCIPGWKIIGRRRKGFS